MWLGKGGHKWPIHAAGRNQIADLLDGMTIVSAKTRIMCGYQDFLSK